MNDHKLSLFLSNQSSYIPQHQYIIVSLRIATIIFTLINSRVCDAINAGHVTHIYPLLVIQTRHVPGRLSSKKTILIGRFFSRDVIPLSLVTKKEESGTKRRKRQFSLRT